MTDDHDIYREWAAAYVLGALDSVERSDYERHLRTCPLCQADVSEFSALPGLLAQLDPETDLPRPTSTTTLRPIVSLNWRSLGPITTTPNFKSRVAAGGSTRSSLPPRRSCSSGSTRSSLPPRRSCSSLHSPSSTFRVAMPTASNLPWLTRT